jgi:dienelactone hydrolase
MAVRANAGGIAMHQRSSPSPFSTERVYVGPRNLPGVLRVPADAIGIVAFAHGSGSSHLSPRNNAVAEELARVGLGTLLFDLLSEDEAGDRTNVFDIRLLAQRLGQAIDWLGQREDIGHLPLGLFGASTGAAAALTAAAASDHVAAVVSRGGRPDMAAESLPLVRAPTLLIVGSLDQDVLALNRQALKRMHGDVALHVVPGATHLFEEPGTMQEVVRLSSDWFRAHLSLAARGTRGRRDADAGAPGQRDRPR